MKESIITVMLLAVAFIVPANTAWTHANWKGVLVGTLTLWMFFSRSHARDLDVGKMAAVGSLLWSCLLSEKICAETQGIRTASGFSAVSVFQAGINFSVNRSSWSSNLVTRRLYLETMPRLFAAK